MYGYPTEAVCLFYMVVQYLFLPRHNIVLSPVLIVGVVVNKQLFNNLASTTQETESSLRVRM